jgi:hypothetical protein
MAAARSKPGLPSSILHPDLQTFRLASPIPVVSEVLDPSQVERRVLHDVYFHDEHSAMAPFNDIVVAVRRLCGSKIDQVVENYRESVHLHDQAPTFYHLAMREQAFDNLQLLHEEVRFHIDAEMDAEIARRAVAFDLDHAGLDGEELFWAVMNARGDPPFQTTSVAPQANLTVSSPTLSHDTSSVRPQVKSAGEDQTQTITDSSAGTAPGDAVNVKQGNTSCTANVPDIPTAEYVDCPYPNCSHRVRVHRDAMGRPHWGLKIHVVSKHDGLRYLCGVPDCPKVFVTEFVRKKHQEKQHGITRENMSPKQIVYVCRFGTTCIRHFSLAADRNAHELVEHGQVLQADEAFITEVKKLCSKGRSNLNEA